MRHYIFVIFLLIFFPCLQFCLSFVNELSLVTERSVFVYTSPVFAVFLA